jgi:hypothetical protein
MGIGEGHPAVAGRREGVAISHGLLINREAVRRHDVQSSPRADNRRLHATSGLLAGGGDFNAAFTVPPFQAMQLRDPAIHTVLSSD